MMFVLWIIPYKSFKKSAKIQTKIKKFNMVNLFSITCRATTFLRDRITKNEQKYPMSISYFWEKFCLHFDDFIQLLKELVSITLSTNELIHTKVFWTSSVHVLTISNQDLGDLLVVISIGKQTEEARISFFHQ